MKKQLFNHHIDLRYILTPVASTVWVLNNLKVKMVYVFGIRVFRTTL